MRTLNFKISVYWEIFQPLKTECLQNLQKRTGANNISIIIIINVPIKIVLIGLYRIMAHIIV